MKDIYYQIVNEAPTITMQRNGRDLIGERLHAEILNITNNKLQICDPEIMPDLAASWPHLKADGNKAELFNYVWTHPQRGKINLFTYLKISTPDRAAFTHCIIPNSVRHDLDEGFFTDSARVLIQSKNQITLDSGLGDGYYPIIAVRNSKQKITGYIIDYEIERVKKYVAMPNVVIDEYGLFYFK